MDQRWMRMHQLVQYVGYSKWTIYSWIKNREFPHSKPTNRGLLFDKMRVDEWLKEREIGYIKT